MVNTPHFFLSGCAAFCKHSFDSCRSWTASPRCHDILSSLYSQSNQRHPRNTHTHIYPTNHNIEAWRKHNQIVLIQQKCLVFRSLHIISAILPERCADSASGPTQLAPPATDTTPSSRGSDSPKNGLQTSKHFTLAHPRFSNQIVCHNLFSQVIRKLGIKVSIFKA